MGGLPMGCHWHYDFDDGVLEFFDAGEMVRWFSIVVAGTTSEYEGTWLWSWANETLPEQVRTGVDRVRQFGEGHGFSGLLEAEWPSVQPDVADVVAVAAVFLDAAGFFRATGGDVTTYLLLDPGTVPGERAPAVSAIQGWRRTCRASLACSAMIDAGRPRRCPVWASV
jgi:hypothetical protein